MRHPLPRPPADPRRDQACPGADGRGLGRHAVGNLVHIDETYSELVERDVKAAVLLVRANTALLDATRRLARARDAAEQVQRLALEGDVEGARRALRDRYEPMLNEARGPIRAVTEVASGELAQRAERLRGQVDAFLAGVRAA